MTNNLYRNLPALESTAFLIVNNFSSIGLNEAQFLAYMGLNRSTEGTKRAVINRQNGSFHKFDEFINAIF